MRERPKLDLGMTGYDEMFMNDQERAENRLPKIFDIPLTEIDDFPDHPFKVRLDEDMEQLIESVKNRGVITPIPLRRKEDGRYEIVSGHRRRKACELAGLETVPAEIEELTREEAICAVLRLGETDPAILEPEGTYVQLSDVGSYDKTIITDDLLNADTDLPEVTQAQLPSDWKGVGLGSSKNEGIGAGCTDFRETDIKFLADNGFNFTRIFFSLSTLRFPDYPEDGRLVNENELRDLDQLIAWGMEYGVHIQIAMSFYLDEGGNEKLDGSIAANDAQWAMVQDYWTMLARRYAGIPSR